jgi:hypothetical protein
MGMDALDIRFRLERTFNIAFRWEEIAKDFPDYSLLTAGCLHAYILGKLRKNPIRKCLGPWVFDRLRAALSGAFGIDPERVLTFTLTADLIPKEGRRAAWKKLRKALGLPLPPLELSCGGPGSIRRILFGQYFTLFVLLGFGIATASQVLLLTVLFLCLGNYLAIIIYFIVISPFVSSIPSSSKTIKGLVRSILYSDYGRIATMEKGWQDEEVWGALRVVLVEALNVTPEEIYPHSHLIDDLGME